MLLLLVVMIVRVVFFHYHDERSGQSRTSGAGKSCSENKNLIRTGQWSFRTTRGCAFGRQPCSHGHRSIHFQKHDSRSVKAPAAPVLRAGPQLKTTQTEILRWEAIAKPIRKMEE